jgi:hypothetical protein
VPSSAAVTWRVRVGRSVSVPSAWRTFVSASAVIGVVRVIRSGWVDMPSSRSYGLLLVRESLACNPGLAQPRPGEIVGLGVQCLPDFGDAGQGRHGDVGFERVIIVPARADEMVHVGRAQRWADHPRRRGSSPRLLSGRH